ncbi:XrtA/PEP-CTERM system TPR-repeat protein PrsT [Colwelliaceae bacterium 6441]
MNIYLAFILLFISVSCFSQQGTSDYEKALLLFQQQNYNAAEIEVKNSIQQNGQYLPARLLLGEILLNKGQFSSAEKELTIALDLYADHQTVIIPLAKTKTLLGKHEEALSLLEKSPQLATLADYQLVRGKSYKALARYSEAEKSYLIYLQTHGEDEQIYTQLADLYYLQAQTKKTHSYVDKALMINASYTPALMLKAELYKKNDSFEQALAIYSKILTLETDNQQALFGKAHVLLELNKLSEALALTVMLRTKYPNDPYTKLLHASIVTLQGEQKKSRPILREIQQQLLSLDDNKRKDKSVLLLSASVDMFNENFNQARQKFIEYISLYGESSLARRHLATIELKANNINSAKIHVEKALASSKNNPDLFLLSAHIYQRQGEFEQYFNTIHQAYNLFQDNTVIRNQYIGALLATNQISQAITLLEESGESLVNQTLLGYLQLQTEQIEKALNTTQQLLDKDPNKLEVLQLAGELSLQLGRESDAKSFFNLALTLQPEFKPALLALAGISLNNKHLGDAEKYYQTILDANPNDAMVLQLYADLAIKDSREKLAITLLSNIKQEHPDYIAVQRILLALYIQNNQLDLAQHSLTLLEKYLSFDQQLLLAKSKLQIKQQKPKHAEKTLKILFGLAYDAPLKLERIAMLQLDIQDVLSAKKTISRLTELTNHQTNPYLLARLALATDEIKKAEQLITLHLSNNKTAIAWQELQAYLYIAQEDTYKATDSLEKLFSQSNNRRHMQLLAQQYMKQAQPDNTKQLLKSWLQLNPLDTWAVSQLSELSIQTADINLAINTLLQYPDLNQHPIFLNNLSNYYLNSDINLALSYAQKAYELLPNLAAINDTLGWAHVKNNQFQQGLSYLREATARDITNANYHYHLAYTLAKLNRIELAQLTLDKAMELNSSHNLKAEINKLIDGQQ